MYVFVLAVVLLSAALLICAKAIYNLYFHPLARFPGPKLWIAFPIIRRIVAIRGNLDWRICGYHEKFGEVVRISNDELSFITADAWKDIYGYGQGHKQLPKYINQEKNALPNIIFSNDADHARYRKSVSHGFSEKGLRAQEPLVKSYVDELNLGLKAEAAAGNPVDLTMWYNLTTFDIISDLAFGKSFGCLKKRGYNEYIRAIFGFIRVSHLMAFSKLYPLLWKLTLGILYGNHVRKCRSTSRELAAKTAMERVNDPKSMGRGDLMDSMLRHRGGKDGLEDWEIGSNANVLFLAGSETTATLLAGVTYQLLKTPDVLRRVTDEVRAAFEREEDINFTSVGTKLPYMIAVLNEGLRTYPPVPSLLGRITQGPTEISGYTVPAKVSNPHSFSGYLTYLLLSHSGLAN